MSINVLFITLVCYVIIVVSHVQCIIWSVNKWISVGILYLITNFYWGNSIIKKKKPSEQCSVSPYTSFDAASRSWKGL